MLIWLLVSVCCVIICKILHRHAYLSSSCRFRVVQMSVSDFKLGWRLTCREPDRSNCTEIKSVVQPLTRDWIFYKGHDFKHNSVPMIITTFEFRFKTETRPWFVFNFQCLSEEFDCLKLWDNNFSLIQLGGSFRC